MYFIHNNNDYDDKCLIRKHLKLNIIVKANRINLKVLMIEFQK